MKEPKVHLDTTNGRSGLYTAPCGAVFYYNILKRSKNLNEVTCERCQKTEEFLEIDDCVSSSPSGTRRLELETLDAYVVSLDADRLGQCMAFKIKTQTHREREFAPDSSDPRRFDASNGIVILSGLHPALEEGKESDFFYVRGYNTVLDEVIMVTTQRRYAMISDAVKEYNFHYSEARRRIKLKELEAEIAKHEDQTEKLHNEIKTLRKRS